MKNIDIIDREIFLPGSLTLVVTGDNRAETIRFRMRTNPELEGFDFYLRYRNSNGEGEEMPLVRTDSERHTFLDWNPDVNFSAITGNTAIMIVGIKTNPANPDVPFVWNSLMADICVERAVGYDSPINPQTPTLLITYLGTFQGLRDEAVEAKDLANQAVVYAQQAATDAESARNEAISAKEGLQDIRDAAVADVNGVKLEAIEVIGSNRTEALSAISGAKAGAIDDIDAEKGNAISDIEAKGSEVIAQIPDIGSIVDEKIEPLDVRINDLESSSADHGSRISGLETEVDGLESDVDEHTERLAQYDFSEVDPFEGFVLEGDSQQNLETMMQNSDVYEQDAIMLSLEPDIPTASTHNFGIRGQIAIDDAYLYVCVADNTWKKIPLQNL